MSGRVLIVDDNPVNVRLLEARLSAEYFDVVTAQSGAEALQICRSEPLDLVVSDVMMPGMDGFELCRTLKSDPATLHLPVVLVTALDQPSDRVMGLEAGADDFLIKPVRDLPLLARVKSLTRLKQVTDELRLRAETASDLMTASDPAADAASSVPNILVLGHDERSNGRLASILEKVGTVRSFADRAQAFDTIQAGWATLGLIDLSGGAGPDYMRFLARCRAEQNSRAMPIIVVTDADDDQSAAKALELGAHDYVQRPVDANELAARTRTQLARYRYGEALRMTVERTLEMAVIDPLTGLYNRRFFDAHMARAIETAKERDTPFAILVADIDHFKSINDRYGHDHGDQVLREFARRLEASVRASDLSCRMGGEEFAVLLQNADDRMARTMAERFRLAVEARPFSMSDGVDVNLTVSAGVAIYPANGSDATGLLRAADEALYKAKHEGRNRIAVAA
ncbi:PleD family two-component system response regulator [Fulvimarina endophytica]|uniref:diguanylate cyclase n=1 Tax=Fulvimarina endophytica TaxID=2293836 RepID=A0A371X7R3_9HYPH|nr:PleD family two-component system response regulator [Fulvimarina endophytica]RFC65263.1 PleD family two-component system response regulator [Fulvimarina endophytica]